MKSLLFALIVSSVAANQWAYGADSRATILGQPFNMEECMPAIRGNELPSALPIASVDSTTVYAILIVEGEDARTSNLGKVELTFGVSAPAIETKRRIVWEVPSIRIWEVELQIEKIPTDRESTTYTGRLKYSIEAPGGSVDHRQTVHVARGWTRYKIAEDEKACYESFGPVRISTIYANPDTIRHMQVNFETVRTRENVRSESKNFGILNLGFGYWGSGGFKNPYPGISVQVSSDRNEYEMDRWSETVHADFRIPPRRAAFIYSNDVMRIKRVRPVKFGACGRLKWTGKVEFERTILPAQSLLILELSDSSNESFIKNKLTEVPQIHTCERGN